MSEGLGKRVIVAHKRHRWNKLEGEIVVLHEDEGFYYTLEGVATRAWELLQRPRTLDEIVGVLTQEYDVSAESCRRDLARCLRELMDRGFVEYQDAASG